MQEKEPENKQQEPTRAELEILQVLWAYGPSTVRFVNDELNKRRDVNYTSTLKLMQIMAEKGILLRDESNMKHIYRTAEEENKTKGQLLNRFVNTLYNGSASKLIMQLLGNKNISEEEFTVLKEILKDLDKK